MSAKPHVCFFIPGLFQPLKLWRKDFAFQPEAGHLLRLCANARMESLPVIGLENTLFQHSGFPVAGEMPFAYYRYWLDFGTPPEQPLLCADPVWLQSGIDQVLLRPELPPLTGQEMETLLALLNPHLEDDGLRLAATHPQRWYLLGERAGEAGLRTTPLSQALGQGIFPLLPQGDKRYWHRLLNEIQMLLHTGGVPAVNALWLWGAANPAALPPPPADGQGEVVGQSAAAQILAVATRSRPQAASRLMDCALGSGDCRIVLEDLLVPAAVDGLQSWRQALDALEENWFAPALAGAMGGRFSVSLSACDGRIFHCQPVPPWQFWRRQQADWGQLI